MAAEAFVPSPRRSRVQRFHSTIPGVAQATTQPIALAPLPTPPPPSELPPEPLPLSRREASSAPSIEVHDTDVDTSYPSIELSYEDVGDPDIYAQAMEIDADEEPTPRRAVGAWGPLVPCQSPAVEEGPLFAGRYRLLEPLCTGGMGGIWSAFDTHLHREVVVKVMSGALRGDLEARRRFEQEAHALTLVASPHIVQMHDHGIVGDSPFIVLERLHGEDLAQRLDRVGHLTLVETEVVLRQLASGIDAAHERRIVHRDLKPANIFLSVEIDGAYASEVVKILDFGVAKLIGSSSGQTRSGITVGSPQFMSPEQVQGFRDLDTRSDLFALGAVVYTCVTGKMPFSGEDLGETFLRICTATYTPPSEIWQSLPRGMDPFFRKAFAVDPERRFTSAIEMWSVFKAIVEAGMERTRAVRTLPPAIELPPVPRSIPERRRHIARVALGGLAAVIALFASVAVADAVFGEDASAASPAEAQTR